jgi:hypothetical protein
MHAFAFPSPFHRPVLAAAIAAALALPTCAGAQVGAPVADVVQTDLFRYFHLQRADSVPDASSGGAVMSYRAGGPFAPLVLVKVTSDAAGRVAAMELDLARAFVDHPMNTVFARDIAKSLIRTAVPAPDLPAVETLANEIEFPRSAPGIQQARLRPAPATPGQPSAGYRAFLGQGPSFDRSLPHSHLLIAGTPGPDLSPWLAITVSSAPPAS